MWHFIHWNTRGRQRLMIGHTLPSLLGQLWRSKYPVMKIDFFFLCKMFPHWWGEYAAYVTYPRWKCLPYLTVFLSMPLLISLGTSLFQRLYRAKGLTGDSQRYRKQLAFCLVLRMLQKEASDICRRASHKKEWQPADGTQRWRKPRASLHQSCYAERLWK